MSIFILLLFFFFFETDLCHEKQHKRERAPTNYDRSLNFYKLLSFFSFRKEVVGSIMMTSPKKKEKKHTKSLLVHVKNMSYYSVT